jgi:ABC-type sugar transport system permease subunit
MQTQQDTATVWSRIKELALKHSFAIALLLPAFIYTAFFTIIIIFSLLQLSLSDVDGGTFATLANYREIIHSSDFWNALWRTVVFVLLGTPLQLAAGLVLAILINRNFVGRGIVRSIFLLPIAIPTIVTAVIVAFMLFSYPFGHINDLLLGKLGIPQMVSEPINWYTSPLTALGLSLFAKVWRDMPISMLILLAGLQSISRDQYEAAQTMGTNAIQEFLYITVPLLVPAISTVLVLRSIEMWKEFIFPFIIAPTYPILGVLIDYLYHEQRSPAKAAALSIILLALISGFTWMISKLLKTVQEQLVKV